VKRCALVAATIAALLGPPAAVALAADELKIALVAPLSWPEVTLPTVL
jgi:hypothetical protein